MEEEAQEAKESGKEEIRESEEVEIEAESVEEKRIRNFQYQTFIVFVVGISVLLIAIVMIIVSIIYFSRSGKIAPQKINAPQAVLTQGLIIVSQNEAYFASFASSFGVYLQSVKPNNNQQAGLVLWQVNVTIPVGSYLNFSSDGILTIYNGNQVVWTNFSETLPPEQRGSGPWELSVSNEGRLQVVSRTTGTVIWQRPEENAFTPIPEAISSPGELVSDAKYFSPSQIYYARFNALSGILGVYAASSDIPVWQSTPPGSDAVAPYICNISIFGNLQVTDSVPKVIWSSQTVNLAPRTLFFVTVTDVGSLVIQKRYLGENPRMVWAQTGPVREGPFYSLSTGETLLSGIFIQSQNGEYRVLVTSDSKFVMQQNQTTINTTGQTGSVVTMSATVSGKMLQMQNNQIVWTNNAPSPARFFPINFVISDSGSLLWVDRTGLVIASSVSLAQS